MAPSEAAALLPLPSSPARHAYLLHPTPALLRAVQALAARGTYRLSSFTDDSALLKALQTASPDLLVCNLSVSPTALEAIRKHVAEPRCAGLRSLFFTPREATPKLSAKVAGISNAELVAGKEKLVTRLVESMANCAGIRPRVHIRPEVSTLATLTTPEGKQISVQLENISQSGAKFVGTFEPEIGVRYHLKATLPEGPAFSSWCDVVRTYSDEDGEMWHTGVAFTDELPAPMIDACRPVDELRNRHRAELRAATPSRLAVKLRLTSKHAPERYHVHILELGPHGLLAASPRRMELAQGQVYAGLLQWGGESLGLDLQLVRARRVGESWQFELRYTAQPARIRAELGKLAARIRSRGLKGLPPARSGVTRRPAARSGSRVGAASRSPALHALSAP